MLRKPVSVDAQAIFDRYASDPEVTRYLAWPCHRAIDDTHAFIQFSNRQWHDHPAGPYLIESRSGLLLGGTGLELETAEQAGTGYVLSRDAWGFGYATEALRAMISVARDLGVRELQAICHTRNAASRRVLEKCGFRCKENILAKFPNLPPGQSGEAVRYELVLGSSPRVEP